MTWVVPEANIHHLLRRRFEGHPNLEMYCSAKVKAMVMESIRGRGPTISIWTLSKASMGVSIMCIGCRILNRVVLYLWQLSITDEICNIIFHIFPIKMVSNAIICFRNTLMTSYKRFMKFFYDIFMIMDWRYFDFICINSDFVVFFIKDCFEDVFYVRPWKWIANWISESLGFSLKVVLITKWNTNGSLSLNVIASLIVVWVAV